ncbi:response regulator transcription factor [Paenibacillus curdlanolyticus]|uniref:response regulator transcription factor n=1 Tax=Paenibacillus curdlanolyticus TaxID=59840 RepID=UPI001F2F1E9E|nr:response regulator transcription factor [Paenibacillus curdlanolyticus]
MLIVDDEPAIREGMTTLIEWESYGFEVCGTAANGRDALEKASILKPDLMLVDIRMPGMTGLELIERLREKDGQCHILILSGYSDFDYARQAIGYRVDGYMLKPVDEGELCENLERIRDSLITEKERQRRQEADMAWRSEQIMKSVVTGTIGEPLDEALWHSIAERLNVDWDGFQVALAEPDIDEDGDPGRIGLLKRKWSRELKVNNEGFVFGIEPYVGVLLRHEEGTGIDRKLPIQPDDGDGFTVFISVGEAAASFQQIHHSYETALEGLKRRFVLGSGIAYAADGSRQFDLKHQDNGGLQKLSLEEHADQLFYALDIGSKDSAERTVMAVAQSMKDARLDEEAVKSYFAQMMSAAFGKLALANPKTYTSVQAFAPAISDIFRQKSLSALVAYLNRTMEETVRYAAERSPETIVKQMEEFIRRNYSENLKLETMAELFNYNSGYLGKLFKTHTGDYFNTYLDKVRIENAKELLAQGLKVHQAAEKVGYASVDYFHTKFKKYEGASPSTFKGRPS